MAELNIAIPDNKVDLVLEAYAAIKGIEATSQAFKAEIINDIKHTVNKYQTQKLAKEIPIVEVV